MNSNKESYRELVSIRRYRVGDYPSVISSHEAPHLAGTHPKSSSTSRGELGLSCSWWGTDLSRAVGLRPRTVTPAVFRAGAARPSSKHAARRSRLEAVTAFSPFSTGKGEPFLPGDCCWKFT